MTQPLFFVDGIDRTTMLKGVSGVTPTGPGSIGRADFFLDKDAGGVDIENMQRVQWYFPHTGTSGVRANGRVFDGLIVNRETSARGATKLWRLTCSDMNLALDFIVRDAAPAFALSISSDSFADQIAFAVQAVQENNYGAVALPIDATNYVANLYTGAMPAVTYPAGKSLRWYIQQICNAAVLLDTALRPRFFMGMSTTFGIGDVFGNPVLHIYDAALEPAGSYTFDEASIIDDTFRRVTESTRMVQRRQAIYGEGFVAVYEEAASGSTYPNPFINHGLSGNKGFFMAVPVEDRDSLNLTDATAKLTRQIQSVAYPRETIYFTASDESDIVKPGDVLDISWALEGMANAIKRGAAVQYTFEPPDKLVTSVQASQRRLKMYEDGDDEILEAPTEGDIIPPGPPTSVAVDVGVYDPTVNMARHRVTWAVPPESDLAGFYIFTQQGAFYSQVRLDTPAIAAADIMLYSGVPYSIFMQAYDTHNNFSEPSNVVTGTAAEPDPSNTLYNPGFEIRSGYNLTLPDGWLVTLGGGGTVALSTTSPHGGVRRVEFNCTSGVGGTSASIKSRYVQARASTPHRIRVWAKGSAAGSVLTLKVHWYSAALALISTTTILSNQAITTAYNQYGGTPIAPANTVGMKVEVAHLVAGSTAVMHVDDVEAIVNPPTDTLYNGSFEISTPNPTIPDGWLIVGAATGILSDALVRDGNLAYKVAVPASGASLTTTSTPFHVIPGNRYMVRYSIAWDASYLNGTDINLIWLDATGATVSTTLVANEFGAAQVAYLDREKGPHAAPSTAASAVIQFVNNVGVGTAVNVYLDAVGVVPDIQGGYVQIQEVAAPSTPATGRAFIYVKTDGHIYIKNAAGTETQLDEITGSDILATQVFR
jgi:hypothetical protein